MIFHLSHFDFDGGVIMILHEHRVFVLFPKDINEGFNMAIKPCISIPYVLTTPFYSLPIEGPVNVHMDLLSIFELEGVELLEIQPDISQLFEKISWGEFFRCFSRHNVEVTRKFSLSLRENV